MMIERHLVKIFGALALICAAAAFADAGRQPERSLGDLKGAWQMQGYGRVFEVTDQSLIEYSITDIGCTRVKEQPLAQAQKGFDRLAERAGGYSYFEPGGITSYAIDRIPQVPGRCRAQNPEAVADPELNYWVLWHALRENYAFFDVHHVDWNQAGERFREGLNASSSEDDLLQRFSGMLKALNDGHVGLVARGKRIIASGGVGELRQLWMDETGAANDAGGTLEFRKAVDDHITSIVKGKIRRGANDAIFWGWLDRGVGYLNVASMGPKVVTETPEEELPATLALVDKAMPQALSELRHARVLVVDARFNGGGGDAVALRIMGYLTSQRFLAFTKKAVMGSGYTEPQPVYVEPVGKVRFTGPVLYLQSGNTISAAEIFSLAMMARPATRRIGTPTYGVLSDVLRKQLPNGWRVTLSNEVYVAVDGNVYEGRGVPPDLPIDTNGVTTLKERLQLDIDMARSKVTSIPPRMPRDSLP